MRRIAKQMGIEVLALAMTSKNTITKATRTTIPIACSKLLSPMRTFEADVRYAVSIPGNGRGEHGCSGGGGGGGGGV